MAQRRRGSIRPTVARAVAVAPTRVLTPFPLAMARLPSTSRREEVKAIPGRQSPDQARPAHPKAVWLTEGATAPAAQEMALVARLPTRLATFALPVATVATVARTNSVRRVRVVAAARRVRTAQERTARALVKTQAVQAEAGPTEGPTDQAPRVVSEATAVTLAEVAAMAAMAAMLRVRAEAETVITATLLIAQAAAVVVAQVRRALTTARAARAARMAAAAAAAVTAIPYGAAARAAMA